MATIYTAPYIEKYMDSLCGIVHEGFYVFKRKKEIEREIDEDYDGSILHRYFYLKKTEKIILDYIERNPDATYKEIIHGTGYCEKTVKVTLRSLREQQIIEREENKMRGKWISNRLDLEKEQSLDVSTSTDINKSVQTERTHDWRGIYPDYVIRPLIHKQRYWGHHLFCEAMWHQYNYNLLEYRQNVRFDLWKNNSRYMDRFNAKHFISDKIKCLAQLMGRLTEVSNGSLKVGLGESEEDIDENCLYEAVEQFTDIYIDLVMWKREFADIYVEESQQSFYEYVVGFFDVIFTKTNNWYDNIEKATNQFRDLMNGVIQETDLNVDLYVKIDDIDMEEFSLRVNQFFNETKYSD